MRNDGLETILAPCCVRVKKADQDADAGVVEGAGDRAGPASLAA